MRMRKKKVILFVSLIVIGYPIVTTIFEAKINSSNLSLNNGTFNVLNRSKRRRKSMTLDNIINSTSDVESLTLKLIDSLSKMDNVIKIVEKMTSMCETKMAINTKDSFKQKTTSEHKTLMQNVKTNRKSIQMQIYRNCSWSRNMTNYLGRSNNTNIEIQDALRTHCNPKFTLCHADSLIGPLKLNKTAVPFDDLLKSELSFVKRGGMWSPQNCRPVNSTAFIIPYRDREEHLKIFLRHLHPILRRQKLHYRIFVIEQDDKNGFNRGKLRNVGFNEVMKLFPYTCIVFHDVDLIPENDRINYGCIKSPTHLTVGVSRFYYRLTYGTIFGGGQMLSPIHYKQVNGFPNIFYQWGAEDDEFSRRVREANLPIHRQSVEIARFFALPHRASDVRQTKEEEEHSNLLYKTSHEHKTEDGLSSLQYKVNGMIESDLYTLIKVDLQKERERNYGIKI